MTHTVRDASATVEARCAFTLIQRCTQMQCRAGNGLSDPT